jgi:hypothetical protein
MKNTKSIARLLKFTVSGHALEYYEGTDTTGHCQGYEDPESFPKPYHWWAHPPEQMSTHFEGYQFPPEGIPVIDIRAAVDTPEGYSWVFKSPLLDVRLPDGAVSRLPPIPEIMLPLLTASPEGRTALACQVLTQGRRAGALDNVSVEEFVQGWKEHGARIGRCFVQNGECWIVWHDTPANEVHQRQGQPALED